MTSQPFALGQVVATPALSNGSHATHLPASSYGIPVLLVEGEPVGTAEAALAGYRILEASDEERADLARGGYVLRG